VIDPRRSAISKMLAGVKRVIAFCSAKGGVGKTFCASVASLLLAEGGKKIGLLDLDFQGASAHVLLGIKHRLPNEKEGILPLSGPKGIFFMGAAVFTGEHALPLRGAEATDAVLELLCVTRWGALDALVVDMPPGIGDEILDLIALIPRAEGFVVSTPSSLSVRVVDRLLSVLKDMGVGVTGVIANMSRGDAGPVREMASRRGVSFIGEVPLDPEAERSIGRPDALLRCPAAAGIKRIMEASGLLP
jgi:ATP-binding protein involved in chromosome partitioning